MGLSLSLRTFVTVIIAVDPLPPGARRVRFECRKLATVWLRGVVSGYPHPSELTVRLAYMAYWDHTFFGILDGWVTSLEIAKVVPDETGRFAVEVPDFADDPITKSFILKTAVS